MRIALVLSMFALIACGSSASGPDPLSTSAVTRAGKAGNAGEDPAAAVNDPTVPATPPIAKPPTATETADAITISNGLATITFDKTSGLADYAFGAAPPIKGAYASVDLGPAGGGYVMSTAYAAHALAGSAPVTDAEGTGLRVTIANTDPSHPTLQQIVTLYAGVPYVFVETQVVSATPISSNYLGALIVDDRGSVTAGPGPDPRVLDVPFDNDEWVRFDSRVLGSPFDGTGYEVTAIYESDSRHGLVVGSVTHDFWKTGIYYGADKGRLTKMNVWGGVATPDVPSNSGPTYGEDGTHDVAKHGAMTGTTLTSPRIFVGMFADWRQGMEAYGKANGRVAPPRTWNGSVPFGWMSWGAYKSNVTADNLEAASDFIKSSLGEDFTGGEPVYVNIDAGLKTDSQPIVDHIHANGQKAGTYAVPFTYFYSTTDGDPLTKPVAGTTFTYGDIVLRDDTGNPIARHGSAYALDVTHPGARAAMQSAIASDVAKGFDWIKLDFMTDGALEGKHFDPTISTGIQAYNQAMQFITSLIPPNVFVSLSIAPDFPSQYAHSRRISCDVLGQLNDLGAPTYAHYGSTEYMLNATTFGWWMNGTIVPFNDPDAMALYSFGTDATPVLPEWSRTRVTASAISGTVFLDSTDYTNPLASARATPILTNPAINLIARDGVAFRPLDGGVGYVRAPIPNQSAVTAGSEGSDVFVRDAGAGAIYVAVFNYDATNAATKAVDLGRAGLDANVIYTVTDLWSGQSLPAATGTLSIPLQPGQATIVKVSP